MSERTGSSERGGASGESPGRWLLALWLLPLLALGIWVLRSTADRPALPCSTSLDAATPGAGVGPSLPPVPAAPPAASDPSARALVSGSLALAGPAGWADVMLLPQDYLRRLESAGGRLDPSRESVAVAEAKDLSFSLEAPAGEYLLLARAEGHLPEAVPGVKVGAGEEVRGLVVHLRPGLAISGTLWRMTDEPADDEPAAPEPPEAAWDSEEAPAPPPPPLRKVPAEPTSVLLEGDGRVAVSRTGPGGAFRFQGLPEGRYRVTAYSVLEGAASAEVSAGAEGVDLVLGRSRVRGRVVLPDGRPAAGAAIFPLERDPRRDKPPRDRYGLQPREEEVDSLGFGCGPSADCWARARSAEDGSFEIDLASGARFQLAAWLGDLRAVEPEREPGAGSVELRLEEPRRFRVAIRNVKPGATVALHNLDREMAFGGLLLKPSKDRELTVIPWRGLRQQLRARDAELVPLDPVPPEITLGELPAAFSRAVNGD